MTSDSSPTNDRVSNVSCPRCHEVQTSDNVRCARCGASLETAEQRNARLAAIEQSRRTAERESVAIQRFPGFGTDGKQGGNFGTRQFFAEMSNQRRRRFIIVLVIVTVGLALLYGH
ncbi:MAG TPA: hypothetical protein VMU68_04085 [Acidimicrobiales bacterium]|nr:hypothetical protein [Acidimicrobiales bacterium]